MAIYFKTNHSYFFYLNSFFQKKTSNQLKNYSKFFSYFVKTSYLNSNIKSILNKRTIIPDLKNKISQNSYKQINICYFNKAQIKIIKKFLNFNKYDYNATENCCISILNTISSHYRNIASYLISNICKIYI
ncbi:hypothetical protein LBMAG18_09230 [Alphaproteobacteria bacterium]|nr:hypothetical protein LBMAG18_09230 [Alphaproteobacteria bacterium]